MIGVLEGASSPWHPTGPVLRRSESLHVLFKVVTVAIATTTTAAVTSCITFAVLLTAVVLPIFAILGGNDN